MREIDPEVIKADGRDVVILQTISKHQSLVKINRMLLMMVFALMMLVFMLGVIVLPDFDPVSQLKGRGSAFSSAEQALQNPVISEEINILKSQLVGLVSGSIESKLRVLEESVVNGRVSHSLGTIQDLKNDVKILRSYSEPAQKIKAQAENERVLAEVSHLKSLVHLTFASCGLMLAAIAGFWIKNRFRLPQKQGVFLGRKDH